MPGWMRAFMRQNKLWYVNLSTECCLSKTHVHTHAHTHHTHAHTHAHFSQASSWASFPGSCALPARPLLCAACAPCTVMLVPSPSFPALSSCQKSWMTGQVEVCVYLCFCVLCVCVCVCLWLCRAFLPRMSNCALLLSHAPSSCLRTWMNLVGQA